MNDILSGTPAITPTATAVLLLLALGIDAMSIGPDSIRDRIAFVMALPVIREGWDGTEFDTWTVGQLERFITNLKGESGQTIAQASTTAILSVSVFILWMFAMGALIPNKYANRFGRFATMNFRGRTMTTIGGGGGNRLNAKLWSFAILLGLLSDIPQGLAGDVIRFSIDVMGNLVAGIPSLLLGVN